MTTPPPQALSHIRVLDLSRVLAGPWCTQNLADLGAEVIKIERPGVGDDTRGWGPPWLAAAPADAASGNAVPINATDQRRDSSYFASANRGKKSVTVDIASAAGQALVRELARGCDVVVENYKVGDLARYGLDYATLSAANPGLVYCSITGYGQSGPSAAKPGYDFVFQALGGLMSITGEADSRPGGGPQKVGVAIVDVMTGMYAAIAILAALSHRGQSGRGQYIDMALLDTAVALGANQVTGYFASGKVPHRHGNAHASLVPYQVFDTADGALVVAVGNDGQWQRCCAALDRPDLAVDPRWQTMRGRIVGRDELVPQLAATLATRSSADWTARLEAEGVPCGPINDYAQVFDDPQVRHRDLRVDQTRPGGSGVATIASPLRLEATPPRYAQAPPALGEHTDDVLATLLGKSAAEIAALRQRGVV